MFNKLVLAAALAAPLGVFGLSSSALAVTEWQPNGDYNPRYDIPLRQERSTHMGAIAARPAMSCTAARRTVREDGYHNVKTASCSTGRYVFDATRHGRSMVLHVDPRTGQVSHT